MQSKPCREIDNFLKYVSYVGDHGLKLIKKGAVCFVPTKEMIYALNGTIISPQETVLEISISPCNSDKVSACQPSTIVNQASVIIIYPDTEINLSKKNDYTR